jgi:NADP-dependent 3-hydroxy acid dehydrogenase YdfG
MSNITDKVVVITGASSGVGESTARLLAGNGAKVALGARRKDRIDALVKDITAKGGCALGFKTDVTKRGDVEALVKGAVDRHGRIDAIVNNSGIMPIAPMSALKVEEWDRMIDVNIKASYMGWPQCFRSCKSKSWATSSTSLLSRASKSSHRAALSTARRSSPCGR